MTVSTSVNRIDYIGNNVITTYTYPFRIFIDSDLEVYVNNVLMTLTTDYTVTGAGSDAGGNVVFTVAPAAVTISIVRSVADTQLVDYVANDAFPAETHEGALDRLTMLIQELEESDRRSIKLAITSSQTNKTIADLVALKYLQVNGTATGIQMSDGTGGGGGGGGSTAKAIINQSSSFAPATIYALYRITTGSGTINVTLPSAVGLDGNLMVFKKIDSGSGNVLILGTIDGTSNYGLVNQNQFVEVTSNGTTWDITSNN